jgi:putative transcriptional regulator
MDRKDTLKSNIMEAVHETASDFHRLGFIDKPKMHEFDILCLAPSQAKSSYRAHNIKK